MEDRENTYKRKGERVKEVRKAAGLSRAELAERINCEKGTLAAIEQGHRNLTLENAELIAKECNVLESYLLLRSDFKTDKEVRESAILSLHKIDVMWTRFLEIVSDNAGYTFIPNESYSLTDAGALKKLNYFCLKDSAGKEIWFSFDDMKDYLSDIQEYASMRLNRIIHRKEQEEL